MHATLALMAFALTLVAGVTGFPCVNDADCSYNGVCSSTTGQCACDVAWRSNSSAPFGCTLLNLLNPVRGAGLHSLDGGRNTSSWGGSSLRDERTGLYHMFASQFTNHCGLETWTSNSHVVRATSTEAGGVYTRVADTLDGEVFPIFSHEPNGVRDPTTGEWALFFTLKAPSGRTPCNCSADGSHTGPCDGPGEGPTVVSWAPAPEGPWSPPLLLLDMGGTQSDTNLAPVILKDGSLVGIWRTWEGGSWPHLVTASNWKNASTYVFDQAMLFPGLGGQGTEDPALYLDARGVVHALFHNMVPKFGPDVAGGHAFSVDGRSWVYTGVAYNSSGLYTDGTAFAFSRRERPHPIMAEDGLTIVALSTGVVYQDDVTIHGSPSFTFVQPVAH
jgi:hypothetical protein